MEYLYEEVNGIRRYHYVYRITNIVENKHYYGKRCSKVLPQLDLGNKYFSSSTDKQFIKDQKANPQDYKYKIVRSFRSSSEAGKHEVILHNKFNVKCNENFYNRCNATSLGYDVIGAPHSEETITKIKNQLKVVTKSGLTKLQLREIKRLNTIYSSGFDRSIYGVNAAISRREYQSDINRKVSQTKLSLGNSASIKAALTKRNTILPSGLTIQQESIIKRANTMQAKTPEELQDMVNRMKLTKLLKCRVSVYNSQGDLVDDMTRSDMLSKYPEPLYRATKENPLYSKLTSPAAIGRLTKSGKYNYLHWYCIKYRL